MRLHIFGLGYCGTAVGDAAQAAGFVVSATTRHAHDGTALQAATHVLSTVPPDATGEPILAQHASAIATAPALRWIGYLSSTAVYGDRGGSWVDEDTPPAPTLDRGHRRLAAETAWSGFADQCAVDIFRLAGIYGPGRSAFDDLRAGRARRIIKPGHVFGRIHRDDIVCAVLAAARQNGPINMRIFNLTDREPAEPAAVIEEAAGLLGMPPPLAIDFEVAALAMSPIARSFWAENRKVASRKTQAALRLTWRYPSFREGLRAVLAEERQQRPP
jgi:nucleoside-diphosphate-sugar epimerase